MGLEEEIEELENEIANTPYNKSTEEHIGRLKSKLAEKKEELERRQSSSGGGGGYAVEQTGDATVSLVGFPSVGKSTLLNRITGADSETGSYDFTTLDVNPGMMKYNGANIQILDVPGLIQGAARGKGDGRKVLSVVRSSDLIVFVLSPFELEKYNELMDELYRNKIRVDETPPKVTVRERGKGGIRINASDELTLDEDTVEQVAREQGFVNSTINVSEDVDIDELIDGLMDNRVYIDSMVAVNKVDLIDEEYEEKVRREISNMSVEKQDVCFLSADEELNLNEFKQLIWDRLGLIRVYMDKPGRGVDYEEPVILPRDSTVGDVCKEIGGDFEDSFRFGRVTGRSAKHDTQQVGKDHVLMDEDELRIVTS